MPHHSSTSLLVLHERQVVLPTHGPMVHVEHGVSLVLEGWLGFDCGQPVRVGPGSMVLVPAGVPHRSLGGEGLTYWLAGFCSACQGLDETMPVMEPFARVRSGALPVVKVPEDRIGWIVSLYEELARAEGPHPERAPHLLSLLMAEVRDAASLGPKLADSPVARALGFIQREAFRPISLRDVAKAVHLSPTHVAAMVKRDTGHTVGDWIAAQRVAEAARWLSHTDASLDEVAERVGWKDKTHFIRMFKRHRGVTPAAWRREHRHG